MNIKAKLFLPTLLMLFAFIAANAQTTSDKWNTKNATKWVQKNQWSNGLKLKLDKSTDMVAFATQYHKNKKVWDEAFAFLSQQNLDKLAPGKYPVDGEKAFAVITEGPEKKFADTKWESHRKYIDLQYVISGKEKMGLAPLSAATVIEPFDGSSDNAHYTSEGKYFVAAPGTFFLFFPNDVHRPNIKVDGYNLVKKLVIKIEVAD